MSVTNVELPAENVASIASVAAPSDATTSYVHAPGAVLVACVAGACGVEHAATPRAMALNALMRSS